MKKLLCCIVAIFVCASSYAQFIFPGWGSTDPDAWDVAYQSADTSFRKVLCASFKELSITPPATFKDMVTVLEKHAFLEHPNATTLAEVVYVIKAGARGRIVGTKTEDKFLKDAWAYCLANPTVSDHEYLNINADKLGTTEAVKIEVRWRILTDEKVTPVIVSKELSTYIKYLAISGISQQEALEKLNTLNRLYTPNLASNVTAWEPIVAQIRTVIEAYK